MPPTNGVESPVHGAPGARHPPDQTPPHKHGATSNAASVVPHPATHRSRHPAQRMELAAQHDHHMPPTMELRRGSAVPHQPNPPNSTTLHNSIQRMQLATQQEHQMPPTMELRPESTVPTSSAVNSANSWKPRREGKRQVVRMDGWQQLVRRQLVSTAGTAAALTQLRLQVLHGLLVLPP